MNSLDKKITHPCFKSMNTSTKMLAPPLVPGVKPQIWRTPIYLLPLFLHVWWLVWYILYKMYVYDGNPLILQHPRNNFPLTFYLMLYLNEYHKEIIHSFIVNFLHFEQKYSLHPGFNGQLDKSKTGFSMAFIIPISLFTFSFSQWFVPRFIN